MLILLSGAIYGCHATSIAATFTLAIAKIRLLILFLRHHITPLMPQQCGFAFASLRVYILLLFVDISYVDIAIRYASFRDIFAAAGFITSYAIMESFRYEDDTLYT